MRTPSTACRRAPPAPARARASPNSAARLRSPAISTTSTRRRCAASCSANAAATVVLPTPPLPVTKRSWRQARGRIYGARPGSRACAHVRSSGSRGAPLRRVGSRCTDSTRERARRRIASSSSAQRSSDLRTLERPSTPSIWCPPPQVGSHAAPLRSRHRSGHHRAAPRSSSTPPARCAGAATRSSRSTIPKPRLGGARSRRRSGRSASR